MTLCEKIRKLRTDAGLSQQQLADALSVSRAAIAKWENDNGTPDIENLRALAAYFHCDVDTLLDETRSLEPPEEEAPKADAPQTYCGKDCRQCPGNQDGTCPGCLDGPGGRYYGKCEIASCCRNHRHLSCESCSLTEHCGMLRRRDKMPEVREEKEAKIREMMVLRRKQATFLWIYVWALVWLMIPQVLANLLSNQMLTSAVPVLLTIGSWLSILCCVVYGAILLRISVLENRFKTAGWCTLLIAGVDMILQLLTGGEVDSTIVLLASIPSLCISLYTLYQEFMGFSALMETFDMDISEQWSKLCKFNLISYGGIVGGLLLMVIMPFLGILGLLVYIAAFIALAVVSVMTIICRYKTAKVISEYK